MKKTFIFTVILISVLLHIVAYRSSLLEQSNHMFFDQLSKLVNVINPAKLEKNAAVIVDIDEKSLEAFGQWPWSRVITAKLFEAVSSFHPAGVAVDIIFAEKDRTSPTELNKFYSKYFNIEAQISGIPAWLNDNDELLAQSIKSAKITLPLYLQNSSSTAKSEHIFTLPYKIKIKNSENFYTASSVLSNIKELQEQAYSTGFINASVDSDGIFRRMPLVMNYDHKQIATLSVASILSSGIYTNEIQFTDTPLGLKSSFMNQDFYTDEHSNILIKFYPLEQYKHISALDVLSGKVNPDDLLGKFAIIGATAIGLHDHYTLASGDIISGILMHATLIENLFNNDIISQPQIFKIINILISFLFSIFAIYMMSRKKYITIIVIFNLAIVLFTFIAVMGMLYNIYLSVGYLLTSFIGFFAVISLTFAANSYSQRKLFYESLGKSHQATLESMALVAETRDTDTGTHIIRTKEYIKLLAQTLAKQNEYKKLLTSEFIETLYHAAPLHDIGKVGIPDSILQKPGKLDFQEFETMKEHSLYGKVMIENAMKHYQENILLQTAKNIAYCHHEKWDGSGYPQGLSGDEIPIEARLMAVADVYDALISKRCYKPSFTYEDAENIIIQGREKHFDPAIVDALLSLKDEFRTIAEAYI